MAQKCRGRKREREGNCQIERRSRALQLRIISAKLHMNQSIKYVTKGTLYCDALKWRKKNKFMANNTPKTKKDLLKVVAQSCAVTRRNSVHERKPVQSIKTFIFASSLETVAKTLS